MRKLSALTFAALLFGQFATTWADPPAGQGNGIGASRSTLQRAVDSRAGLQQRANLRAQGSANGGTGVGIGGSGVGQNSVNANGNVGVSANIQTDADGSANAQSGTGRLPREVVTRRLQLLRNQQAAIVRNATRTELGIGIDNDSPSDAPTQSDKKPQPNNKRSSKGSGQGSNPNSNSNENSDSSNQSGLPSLNGSARSEIVAHGQNRLALTNADRLLAQRLARIDQMRDQALETGNDQLLDQADRLELQARTKYAERLAGGANDSSSQAGADAQGQANAAAQSTTAATLSNKTRRAKERTRPDTNPAEPAGKIRSASFNGQANSTNTADAAAGNNSLDAAATSTTNASGNVQSK